MCYNQLELERNVILLMELQCTPAWFMQQFRRITGMTASAVLRALGRQQRINNWNENIVHAPTLNASFQGN